LYESVLKQSSRVKAQTKSIKGERPPQRAKIKSWLSTNHTKKEVRRKGLVTFQGRTHKRKK